MGAFFLAAFLNDLGPRPVFSLIKYYFSVDAVVWLMEHMEEVDTEMKAIQVNKTQRKPAQ